jgi:hypothetical protein
MANTRYSLAKAVARIEYQPAFRQKSEEQLWPYDKICGMKSTKAASEIVFGYSGLAAANQTGELEPIFYTDMHELDSTTFTVNKYTLATMFSHEAMKDNLHLPELLGEAGTMMGESMAYIKAQAIAAPLNRAFNSNYAMYDGVELCGTHTLKSGDSFDNDLTPASLTFDNLWLAINHFETSLLQQSGLYLKDTPKYLVYHPSKEKEVQAILQSQLEPGTANNDKNTIKNYNLVPVSCRFLSTSTNWFLASEKFKSDLLFWDREKPNTQNEEDFDRMGLKVRNFCRFAVGVRDFLRIVGNPGA